jgi:CubicO group peptidase (beta-lactamase class C family)
MTQCETLADRAWAPVLAALQAGRIPGAVLGVLDGGSRALRHAGFAQIVPDKVAMTAETVFDLASLTKVLHTTHAILLLVEQGRLTLDTTLGELIPDLRQYNVSDAIERRLTVRQCLTHQTHLPAVEPLYTYGQNPATLRAFILQRFWKAGPPVYSDINFLLLGIALERLTGVTLAAQSPPPGLSFKPNAAHCAATEFCTWRGRVLRGEVHDENAFAMGGAAGHAGLFGSADAVLDYANALLLSNNLAASSVTALRERHSPTRALGWEAMHRGWSGGDTCSNTCIGHTGFTGTGVWIDWERRRAWTLLTNRVHPTRHFDSGIIALRRQVGEAICG